MTEFCPLCGAAVMRPEDEHACYDPPSLERLFRDPGWGRFWTKMKPTLGPQVVSAAYHEFAVAKSQGREATRLFALQTYKQFTAAIAQAEDAKRQGRDPRELYAQAFTGLKAALDRQAPGTGG